LKKIVSTGCLLPNLNVDVAFLKQKPTTLPYKRLHFS